MAKEKDTIRTEGVVTEALPNATFRVKLDSGPEILTSQFTYPNAQMVGLSRVQYA